MKIHELQAYLKALVKAGLPKETRVCIGTQEREFSELVIGRVLKGPFLNAKDIDLGKDSDVFLQVFGKGNGTFLVLETVENNPVLAPQLSEAKIEAAGFKVVMEPTPYNPSMKKD